MKRYFFPFSQKYKYLNKYWWHRLLAVIFIVIIFSIGYFTWQSSLQSEVAGYSNCYQLNSDIYDGTYNYLSPTKADKQWETAKRECLDAYPIHSLLDFGLGLIMAIITFYLLQFIYYKIILYIVFGSTYNKSNL